MRTNIRPFLRFAAFFLVLALAVALANTCLIQTDTFVALMMDELKNSRDIELAVVGSSIVRDHFNAEMISKEIGKTCFALGIPCGMLQATSPRPASYTAKTARNGRYWSSSRSP